MKIQNFFLKGLLLCLLSAILISCNPTSQQGEERDSVSRSDSANQNQEAQPKLIYQIINAPENTFGYQIVQNGNIIVNQPHIPGMAGVKGFKSHEDAAKVAELVIEKIKNNQMPPSVTPEELYALGVLEKANP